MMKPFILEVCQGTDCFGGGGGAVILEIEELIQEYNNENDSNDDDGDVDCVGCSSINSSSSSSNMNSRLHRGRIQVVKGGCRNYCSVGPNLHYYHHDDDGQQQQRRRRHLHHFTKVSSVEECCNVVSKCISFFTNDCNIEDDADVEGGQQGRGLGEGRLPVVTKLVLRQAEKQRWHALRLLARIQTSPTKVPMHQIEDAKKELYESFSKDERAVISYDKLHASNTNDNEIECRCWKGRRQQRRRVRLVATLHRIVKRKL